MSYEIVTKQHPELGEITEIAVLVPKDPYLKAPKHYKRVSQIRLTDNLFCHLTNCVGHLGNIHYATGKGIAPEELLSIIERVEALAGEESYYRRKGFSLFSDDFHERIGQYDIDYNIFTSNSLYAKSGIDPRLSSYHPKRIIQRLKDGVHKPYSKEEQVDDVSFLWDQFMLNHKILAGNKKGSKRCKSAIERQSVPFAYMHELFASTRLRKGLTVTFRENEADEVYDKLACLSGRSEKPETKAEEPELPKGPVKDPWKVRIPEIGEGIR